MSLLFSTFTHIYFRCGHTDMRKGIPGLSDLSSDLLSGTSADEVVIAYRGKSADKLKILWWDGQGYCLFIKYLESGKFLWNNIDSEKYIKVTAKQFSLLIEGLDWRIPNFSVAPST